MKKTLATAIVGITLSASAQAEISWQQVDDMVAATQPQVVEWRRWFHENPELSNREFNTSKGWRKYCAAWAWNQKPALRIPVWWR